MYRFEQSYSLMKLAFENEKRNSWERYFEHLKWVMDVILDDLENPNINKVVIALLHDVQEDLPEYADVIRKIYGNYIADWVDALSKKEWEHYIEKEELEICWVYLDKRDKLLKEVRDTAKIINPEISFTAIKKIKETDLEKYMTKEQVDEYKLLKDKLEPFENIAKERRNEDYFWHLDDLCDDYLDVKFADRIHNLRDIDGEEKEKIIRKVQETEKYFLDVAKRRNPTAYNLMMIEIQKTKEKFGF